MKLAQKKEKIIDCFAGGGGSSCGTKMATGRSPHFALNHNKDALDMHAANHPLTKHILEDIWRKLPESICNGDPIGLALFSPDCRHFSLARGGAPTSPRVRSLAWSVVWYAKRVKPRVFIVENVREFLSWGPLMKDGRPNPKLKGKTFKAWVRALKREKYQVEWRVLDAADYGVPTHRRRLFVIGRRDGEPIRWPEQTHASPAMMAERPLIFGGMQPYRTAAECIDFDLPTRSIFERKKDLAEKTQRRIAKGFMRFVVENPKPYIVRLGQTGGNGSYSRPSDEPLTTVTTKAEHCIVTPTLVQVNHAGDDPRARDVGRPMGTVTEKHGQAIACASIVELAHGGGGTWDDGRSSLPTKPLGVIHSGGENHNALLGVSIVGVGGRSGQTEPTGPHDPVCAITSKNDKAVVAATLVGVGGTDGAGKPRPVGVPAGTVLPNDRRAVVAASVVKFRGDSPGHDANDPCPTITSGQGAERPAGAAHALGMAAVYLARFNHGDKQWNGVDEPLGVVTTQGNKFALVYAWLMKYHGNAIGNPLNEPSHTVDGNDRYALVKVFVETSPGVREPAIMLNVPGVGPCLVADIHLRMLTPRELARCQGFPDSYILTGSKSNQVARIGNSVPPPMIEALVRANYLAAKPKRKAAIK